MYFNFLDAIVCSFHAAPETTTIIKRVAFVHSLIHIFTAFDGANNK